MRKIEFLYQEKCKTPSDINEHLPTLYKYAKECDHITEMGVRWGASTCALLYSEPKKMISYDIVKSQEAHKICEIARECGLNYDFLESDVLNLEIENTELLFIDTLHVYDQLVRELSLHSAKVSKYIILHDTESFAYEDEIIYDHASSIIKNSNREKKGIWNAVLYFLTTELGSYWEIFDKYNNNNGLTVLKRLNFEK